MLLEALRTPTCLFHARRSQASNVLLKSTSAEADARGFVAKVRATSPRGWCCGELPWVHGWLCVIKWLAQPQAHASGAAHFNRVCLIPLLAHPPHPPQVGDFGLSIRMDPNATHISQTWHGTLTHMWARARGAYSPPPSHRVRRRTRPLAPPPRVWPAQPCPPPPCQHATSPHPQGARDAGARAHQQGVRRVRCAPRPHAPLREAAAATVPVF